MVSVAQTASGARRNPDTLSRNKYQITMAAQNICLQPAKSTGKAPFEHPQHTARDGPAKGAMRIFLFPMRTQLSNPELYWRSRGLISIAGVDEAGRGALAGPVVAAAVILADPEGVPGLRDSKTCSPAERERLLAHIEQQAVAIGIGRADPEEIDRLNILQATFLAMHRAIEALQVRPELLLVDGPHFRPCWIPHQTVIRGDSLCPSIMAASIVAKVTRDRLMEELDRLFPHYGWARNKGYPTAEHYTALACYGPSPWHRRGFRLSRG